MKRMVCVILVAVMVACCVACVAEESSSVKEESRKNMGLVYLMYKVKPEELGPDMLIYGYLNLVTYLASESSDLFFMVYGMEDGNKQAVTESFKPVGRASANMIKVATDAYLEWIDGKLTDSHFAEILMEMIGAATDLGNGDEKK